MSTAQKHFISPQEYLERERKAEFRSEYYRGEMFAMSGGIPHHSLIKSNLIAELVHKIERFSRNDDGTWTWSVFDSLNEVVALPTIGISLSLAAIYDKVDFTLPLDSPPGQPS